MKYKNLKNLLYYWRAADNGDLFLPCGNAPTKEFINEIAIDVLSLIEDMENIK